MASDDLQRLLQPLVGRLALYFNAHRFMWLLALACFLIAWNRGIALLYGLLALLLAVLAVSWLLPWRAVRSVRLNRWIHGFVQANRPFTVHYDMHVPRRRYHLALSERFPSAEGGEPAPHFLPCVEKHTSFSVNAVCNVRGVFDLDTVDIGCAWPFGFVYLQRPVPTPPCRLAVAPATFPMETFPVLRSGLHARDGHHRTPRPAMQAEFAGVREYRYGDSLKHIHWPASARHQELIVREYESHDRPHLLVVLDARPSADVGQAPYSTFEYAVTIAASLIEYAIEQQWGLHVYAAGRQPFQLTVAAGSRSSRSYLERLAWLKADGDTPYPQAVRQALGRFGDTNALVTFRNHSETPTLPDIRAGHCDIVLLDQSFIYPARRCTDGWRQAGEGRTVLEVHCNSNLAALFRL